MKAIILTSTGDKSVLDHHLSHLKDDGISTIFLVIAANQADVIKNQYANQCKILINDKYASTGSIYALWLSKKDLFSDEFLILDGDKKNSAVKVSTENLSLFWGRVEEIIQNNGAHNDFQKACDVLKAKPLPLKSQIKAFLVSMKVFCKFFIQSFIPAFFYRPVAACKFLMMILNGSLTPKGYDLQIYGSKLLKIILEESQKVGLKPFFVWGTLLGCVREGGFIINDDDLDFAVLSEDFKRVELLIKPMLERGFILSNNNEYQISFRHPQWHKSFAVDIEKVYSQDGHMVITTINEGGINDFSHLYPMDTFASFKTVKFIEGIDVLIPAKPEIFLESAYGNWRSSQKKGHYAYGYLNFVAEPKKQGVFK